MDPKKFDLVVLGGGPAGIAGAMAAAIFGKTVALVERCEEPGGAGINTGTLPSKTLRESALLLSGWRARKILGIEVAVRPQARLAEFMHHQRDVTRAECLRVERNMHGVGVVQIRGRGKFLDPRTIRVEGAGGEHDELRGETILVATGSSPVRPPEFPFEHPRVHDSDEILAITEMPRVLAVVGAGVIGAEYASTFAALGVEVHLLDGRETLLPFLDEDLSSALLRAMTSQGIRFHWKERVTRCEPRGSDILLSLSSGGTLTVTDVLVAAGRTSNTEHLDLAAAGLVPGNRGLLEVDRHYRTSVPHIFAAGDVIGPPALAGTGMEQARVAMCHAFGAFIRKESSSLLPTGIYTIPEVSMVGETEQSLKRQGVDFVVGRADYSSSPRGKIIGDETGFVKLLFRAEDMRLLGVHVLGEQASELVHIGLVALHAGAGVDLFNEVCFNYPTLGDLYKYAAYDAILKRGRARQST